MDIGGGCSIVTMLVTLLVRLLASFSFIYSHRAFIILILVGNRRKRYRAREFLDESRNNTISNAFNFFSEWGEKISDRFDEAKQSCLNRKRE